MPDDVMSTDAVSGSPPTIPAESGAADTPPDPAAEVTAPEPAVEETSAPEPKEEVAEKEPAAAEPVAETAPSNKRWYVVKVQSGREDSIKEAIERRVKIEALEEYFGQIVIPVEHITELRNGKRVHKYRKLYPGYLMCEVEYNDKILYLFRETPGVGDFVGGSVTKPPPPMSPHEIDRMIHQKKEPAAPGATAAPPKPKFDRGDRVRVRDGIFSGMEGEVKDILEQKGQVRVELTIFGRPTGVELEYWQVEQV